MSHSSTGGGYGRANDDQDFGAPDYHSRKDSPNYPRDNRGYPRELYPDRRSRDFPTSATRLSPDRPTDGRGIVLPPDPYGLAGREQPEPPRSYPSSSRPRNYDDRSYPRTRDGYADQTPPSTERIPAGNRPAVDPRTERLTEARTSPTRSTSPIRNASPIRSQSDGFGELYSDLPPRKVLHEDVPTSKIPSLKERAAEAAATVAEAERRGIFYLLARERMVNRRSTDFGLLLLRLAPLILILHGAWKVQHFQQFLGMLGDISLTKSAPTVFAYLAIGVELAFPVLILFGLGTRVVAALTSVHMLVAFWIAHSGKSWIAATGGLANEGALLYALIALPLIFCGAGRYSLDYGITSDVRERKAERQADVLAEE